MERWNIDLPKDNSDFNFIVNPVGSRTINPTLHHPRTHYSNIPVFQHSNWGEAPNLQSSDLDQGPVGELASYKIIDIKLMEIRLLPI